VFLKKILIFIPFVLLIAMDISFAGQKSKPKVKESKQELIKKYILDLKYGSYERQNLAIQSLGRIGDTSVVPSLVEFLKNEMPWIRKSTAEALGNIGDKSAVPALVEAKG